VERSPYPFHRILNLARALEVYHRQSVRQKGHLDDRMRHLWERQPPRIQQLLGDKEAFADQAADSRDHYTHYNHRDYEADTGSEAILAAKLRMLLTSVILQELGFTNHEIEKMAATRRGGYAFQLPTVVA